MLHLATNFLDLLKMILRFVVECERDGKLSSNLRAKILGSALSERKIA